MVRESGSSSGGSKVNSRRKSIPAMESDISLHSPNSMFLHKQFASYYGTLLGTVLMGTVLPIRKFQGYEDVMGISCLRLFPVLGTGAVSVNVIAS